MKLKHRALYLYRQCTRINKDDPIKTDDLKKNITEIFHCIILTTN